MTEATNPHSRFNTGHAELLGDAIGRLLEVTSGTPQEPAALAVAAAWNAVRAELDLVVAGLELLANQVHLLDTRIRALRGCGIDVD